MAVDDPERHELTTRLWLFFSPFLFPSKKREKKKRRMKSKSHAFLDHHGSGVCSVGAYTPFKNPPDENLTLMKKVLTGGLGGRR